MTTAAPSLPEYQIRLPQPHHGMVKVEEEMRRFNVLNAGRRWHKTTTGVRRSVKRMFRNEQIVWGAPTYKQIDIAWDEFKYALHGVGIFNRQRMQIILPDALGMPRGSVTFRSLDNPDNARGLSADGIVIDEAADVSEDAYRTVLRPMLLDTMGWVLLVGTPKGRNWFYYQFLAAKQRADGAAWQIPTLGARLENGALYRVPHEYENPDIPFAELQNMLYGDDAMPERTFRQEILAEFVEDAGGVFQRVDAVIGGTLLPHPPHGGRQYMLGLDIAKYNDFTALVVVDAKSNEVVYTKRLQLLPWDVQEDIIATVALHWNNALIYLDSTGMGGDIEYERLVKRHLRVEPYQFTQRSRQELIDNAVVMVAHQQVSIPAACENLLREMKAFAYTRLPAGGLRADHPSGQHDDELMAFMLALWPLGHRSAPMTNQAYEELKIAPDMRNFGGTGLMGRTF